MKSSLLPIQATRIFLVAILGLYSLGAQADRLRHCDAKLEISLQERDANLQGFSTSYRTLYSNFKTAGFHGGIQANTARERARERLKSCVSYWFSDRSNLPSEKLNECDNSTVHSSASGDDFLNRTLNQDIQEALVGNSAWTAICGFHHFYKDQVYARARLTITGDNRCGETKEYALNLGPKYKFCSTARVYEPVPPFYLDDQFDQTQVTLKNTLDSKTLANRIMFAENALYMFDKVPNGHRDLLFGVDDFTILMGVVAFSAITFAIDAWYLEQTPQEIAQLHQSLSEAAQTAFIRQNGISAWDVIWNVCTGSIGNQHDEHKLRMLVRTSSSDGQCNGFEETVDPNNLEVSDNGHYAIDANDRSRLWVRHDATVPAQLQQQLSRRRQVYMNYNGQLYFAFIPARMYMRDCCHTAEEIMASEKLQQDSRNSYVLNSEGSGYHLSQNVIPFGDYGNPNHQASEAQRYYSNLQSFASTHSGSVDNNASPNIGQAYAVARMNSGAGREYPFHVAAVIAEDDETRVTMEVFATARDANGYNENPNFRMYSTRTGRTNQTFHQTWASQLGTGARTFVLGSLILYLRNLQGGSNSG